MRNVSVAGGVVAVSGVETVRMIISLWRSLVQMLGFEWEDGRGAFGGRGGKKGRERVEDGRGKVRGDKGTGRREKGEGTREQGEGSREKGAGTSQQGEGAIMREDRPDGGLGSESTVEVRLVELMVQLVKLVLLESSHVRTR